MMRLLDRFYNPSEENLPSASAIAAVDHGQQAVMWGYAYQAEIENARG